MDAALVVATNAVLVVATDVALAVPVVQLHADAITDAVLAVAILDAQLHADVDADAVVVKNVNGGSSGKIKIAAIDATNAATAAINLRIEEY